MNICSNIHPSIAYNEKEFYLKQCPLCRAIEYIEELKKENKKLKKLKTK